MGIKVAICGVGAFGECFIPLFKAHPNVDEIILCDLNAERLKAKCEKFDIAKSSPSLDDLCERDDVDAITIFTQHHLHGPQAVQALRAGKHVLSAVPPAITVDEMRMLVETVAETDLICMLAETSYYYPCAIYCRERFRKGDFGEIVYAEAEYIHDYHHGVYEVMKRRHQDQWQQFFGMPPLFYPTHSMSLIVSVTGARATHDLKRWRSNSETGDLSIHWLAK